MIDHKTRKTNHLHLQGDSMKNLFSFLFCATISTAAITILALYDDKKAKEKSATLIKESVNDHELDEIINDTEKEISDIDKIQERLNECASELETIAKEAPNSMEKHLSILDKQNSIFEELPSN